MTYVSGGDVVAKRSPWRLSIVTDMFWGVINFVGLLYVALVLYCLLAVVTYSDVLSIVFVCCIMDSVTTIFSDPSTATRPNSNIGQGSTSSRGLGGNGRGGPRRMGGVNHRGTINQPMGGGCCG
ncbi:hypothetical protein JG688_00011695 [Phytophthora aleatoria]|uniref:Selenoprotein K n=1 Tax=Phytophthora aleatoria TaxID=2496075 RepID=A0A8J5IJU6_9STRA|nr:hypothetical protein JG688_00011695 [Phytophthora aleatoria]